MVYMHTCVFNSTLIHEGNVFNFMRVTRIKLIFKLSLQTDSQLVFETTSSQGNTSLIQKPIAALTYRRQMTGGGGLELM